MTRLSYLIFSSIPLHNSTIYYECRNQSLEVLALPQKKVGKDGSNNASQTHTYLPRYGWNHLHESPSWQGQNLIKLSFASIIDLRAAFVYSDWNVYPYFLGPARGTGVRPGEPGQKEEQSGPGPPNGRRSRSLWSHRSQWWSRNGRIRWARRPLEGDAGLVTNSILVQLALKKESLIFWGRKENLLLLILRFVLFCYYQLLSFLGRGSSKGFLRSKGP